MNFSLQDIRDIIDKLPYPPTGGKFLDNRYNWQAVDNHQEWPYYRVFYHLAALLKPSLVVELGGFQGTAAAHFAGGNVGGTGVITIDHHTDPGDEINQIKMLEACKEYPEIKYFQGWTTDRLALEQRGRHHLGDAPSAFPKVQELVRYHDKKIDVLFIDGWHRYDKAIEDWIAYKPLLNSPALVICDDITGGGDDFSPISGMLRFWDELEGEKFLDYRVHPGTNMGFLKYDII